MNEFILDIRGRVRNKAAVYPVSHATGKLLQILIELSKAEKILELGLGYGASALYMAAALPIRGRLDSIEVNTENAAVAASYIEKAGLSGRVNIMKGDAQAVLEQLQDQYDGVFLDIEVGCYCECLDEIIRLTKPGGFILAENIWDEPTAYKIGGINTVKLIQSYRSRISTYEGLDSSEINDCILTLKSSSAVAGGN